MSHIPFELIASNPSGIVRWQAAAFIVDAGEIYLSITAKAKLLVKLVWHDRIKSACGKTLLWRLRAAKTGRVYCPA
jgi:hypothetical protein